MTAIPAVFRPRESPDRNPLADLHPEGETGPAIGVPGLQRIGEAVIIDREGAEAVACKRGHPARTGR